MSVLLAVVARPPGDATARHPTAAVDVAVEPTLVAEQPAVLVESAAPKEPTPAVAAAVGFEIVQPPVLQEFAAADCSRATGSGAHSDVEPALEPSSVAEVVPPGKSTGDSRPYLAVLNSTAAD